MSAPAESKVSATTGSKARWKRRARSAGAAVLAGVLVFLAFPTWDYGPLAFLAWVPLIGALEHGRGGIRRAFALGCLAGLVANVGGFYWIIHLLRDFAFLPLWLCVLLMVLLAAQQGVAFGLGAAAARAASLRGVPVWLAYPLAVTAADAFWPMIFKWNLGHSQYENHALAQWAEWGGAPAVTFWLLVVASCAAMAWTAHKACDARMRLRWLGALVSAGLVSHGAGWARLVDIDRDIAASDTLRVGLVEADIGIYEKSDPERYRNNLLLHQHLSRQAEEQGAELVVWPETAYLESRKLVATTAAETLEDARRDARLLREIPSHATWLPPSRAQLVASWREDEGRLPTRDVVPPHRGWATPLLTGTILTHTLDEAAAARRPERRGRRRDVQYANSALLLSAEGRVLGAYDKIALMPFSERVPLGPEVQRWLGVDLYSMIPSAGDFFVGSHVETLALPRETRDAVPWELGMMICYEDIMPHHGRRVVRENERVDVLMNITNDAWFGKTSEPYLHMALSTFRAIEARTALVRSTNTGVSCVIDPAGRILAQTSIEDAEVLVEDVPMLAARQTLFVRFGDGFAWLCALGLVVLGIRARVRNAPEI